MLFRTFLFLPGVDERTERRLWQVGCRTWWHLLERDYTGFSATRLALWRKKLSLLSTRAGDLDFLARRLAKRHHWRLFKHFKKEAIFLDIETDGLRKGQHQVTVLGLFDGQRYHAFIAGRNLEEGLSLLQTKKFWVTFGGSFFDWPFLKESYPWLKGPVVHLDLCPLFKRLGLKGGLKRIEKALGLARPEEIDGFDGYMAVKLWRRWRQRRDHQALARLVAYNREDVVNLAYLAEVLYAGLCQLALTGQTPALTVSSSREGKKKAYDGADERF